MDRLYHSDMIIDREWNEYWSKGELEEVERTLFVNDPPSVHAEYINAWWAYDNDDVSFEEVGW